MVANWQIIEKDRSKEVIYNYVFDINDDALAIDNDESCIKQIINNLIDNAFKFTCLGSVTLSVGHFENKLLFSVKDAGIGVSKESMPFIFERFRKSEESNNQKFRGAGLGLTISKKLANLLGGELWVESESGKGSTFYLEIPDK